MARKRLGCIKARVMFSKGLRKCVVCHKVKSLKLFYKNKCRHGGYAYECKKCKNAFHKKYRQNRYVKKAEGLRAKKYRIKHRKELLNKRYLKQYGISYNDKIKIIKQQRGKCRICNKKINEISGHLDHCHKTKKVRGILCSNCNTGIGLFKNNIEFLKRAIKYLRHVSLLELE